MIAYATNDGAETVPFVALAGNDIAVPRDLRSSPAGAVVLEDDGVAGLVRPGWGSGCHA
jgi:hypothetical protein